MKNNPFSECYITVGPGAVFDICFKFQPFQSSWYSITEVRIFPATKALTSGVAFTLLRQGPVKMFNIIDIRFTVAGN